MNILILAIGAYFFWRLAAQSSKPSQRIPQEETTLPSDQPKVYLDRRKVSMVNRFDAIITDTAETLKLDSNILKGLIYMMSGGDDGSRWMQPDSEYGYGLTQITCSRARYMREHYEGIEGVQAIDDCLVLGTPINSVWYGAVYLKSLFQGNWLDALGRYFSPTEAIFPTENAVELAQRTLAVADVFRQI